jgi:hypothetical protein
MRAIVSVLFVLLVLPGAVQAQPGQTPPPPPMGPAQPPPQQQPYPPPPPGQPQAYPPPQGYPPPQPYAYPYGPPVQLTAEEQNLLAEGEISLGQHAGGVALDWFFGFGLGQAVQGRWSDTGWIFTLGEAAGLTMLVVGITRLDFTCDSDTSCNNDDAGAFLVTGLIAYVGFHAWSIVDAAIGPAKHNRKVRELKRRVGIPVEAHRVIPYTKRLHDGGGTVGLTFRF